MPGRQYPFVDVPQVDPTQGLRGLSNLMQLARIGSAFDAESAERKSTERMKTFVNEAKGDYSAAATLADRAGHFTEGTTLRDTGIAREREVQTRRQADLKGVMDRLDQHTTTFGTLAQILQETTVNPAMWSDVRPRMVDEAGKVAPEFAAMIPKAYNPTDVQGLTESLQRYATDTETRKRGVARLAEAQTLAGHKFKQDTECRRGVGDGLASASSAEEWDGIKDYWSKQGVPAPILEAFGEWDEEAPKRARTIAMTPAERAAEARASVTARPNTIQEALLDPNLTPARKEELLGLQRAMSAAQREPEAGVDRASVQAILKYPHLWRAVNPELRGKLMAPLAAAGFDFPAAAEGLTPAEITRLRVSDIRQLDRERRRVDAGGERTMTDVQYREERAQIEEFYRSLSGEPTPARGRGTPPPTAPGWAPPGTTRATPPPGPARQAPQASQFTTTTASGGKVTVTAPDGSTVDFASQAEADAAIQAYLASLGQP